MSAADSPTSSLLDDLSSAEVYEIRELVTEVLARAHDHQVAGRGSMPIRMADELGPLVAVVMAALAHRIGDA